MGLLSFLFGNADNKLLKEAIEKGADLVDVRSSDEFKSGNIEKSRNIPLDNIESQLSTLDKNQPIVVFCRSGARSARAKVILEKNGFQQVINGGSWRNVSAICEQVKL